MLLRLLTAAVLTLPAGAVVLPAAADDTVTVTADYATTSGMLDKARLLNVSQGGYAALQNLHVLPDQAAEFAALGVRQFRVDHVFDDAFYDVVRGAGYDFAKLDAVLRPFIAAGIRPWISLSYMPAEIGPTLFSPPYDNDYTRWRHAVTALVGHVRAEFGLTGLNWEVWNEPDHEDRDGGWWTGTHAQYHELYRNTAEAVRLGDPSARVGGPALARAEDALLDSWLDFIAANPGVPSDFVSWHHYGGAANFDTTRRVRTALESRGLGGKQLYVSEWNSTFEMANGEDTWPDTHQTASYAAHRMYSALTNPDGIAGIFFFTGLEAWHPTLDFNGDLGMITVDGRRKAVGNTYAMIESMAPERVPATVTVSPRPEPGACHAAYGMVTKDPASRRVTVLLWNNTRHDTTFMVHLDNLPDPGPGTNVAVTRYDIDATAGNAWTDRKAGIANQRPSPHERLRPSSRTVGAPSASWSASVSLPANGTTLLELAPSTEQAGPKPVPPVRAVVNLARDAVVSASSTETLPAAGWSPAGVADGRRHSLPGANSGNPAMGWSSVRRAGPDVGTRPEHVQVDLGAAERFDAVTLWPRDDQGGDGHAFPAAFTVSGSADGTQWTMLASRSGDGGAAVTGPQTFPVRSGPYRYVRVTATRLGLPVLENQVDAYRFQLAELEVTKPGSDVVMPDPGFQSGQLSGWTATGNGRVVATGGRSGAPAATFTGGGNGVRTTVTGLQPDTSYTFAGYLRSAVPGDAVHLGVKDYGGPERSHPVGTTAYTRASVTFTTGPANTSATVYAYRTGGTAQGWFDDFTLVRNL